MVMKKNLVTKIFTLEIPYGTKRTWYETFMVRSGHGTKWVFTWYEMDGTKWTWYETTSYRLVNVSPYSKLNVQEKKFFTQNWCNITLIVNQPIFFTFTEP